MGKHPGDALQTEKWRIYPISIDNAEFFRHISTQLKTAIKQLSIVKRIRHGQHRIALSSCRPATGH